MSVADHANREYTVSDKDTDAIKHKVVLLEVIETVPDLTNDELCSIIDLEVGQAWEINSNILVIRTA
jgi:hypothetical protein